MSNRDYLNVDAGKHKNDGAMNTLGRFILRRVTVAGLMPRHCIFFPLSRLAESGTGVAQISSRGFKNQNEATCYNVFTLSTQRLRRGSTVRILRCLRLCARLQATLSHRDCALQCIP